MAELLVMPRVRIPAEDWTWDKQPGVWTATTARICPLTQGREYRMYGDGSGYEPSAAQDIGALIGMPMVAVGGLGPFGMPSNGSPYVIGDGGSFNMFAVTNRGQSYPPGNVTFSLAMMVKGNVVFQGQELEFEVESNGMAHTELSPAPFELVVGEIYGVVIDGVERELTCTEVDLVPCLATFDFENEDPVDGDFAIGYLTAEMSSGESLVSFIIQDSTKAANHTIAIYQAAGAGILLRDHTGTPVEYELPQSLRVDTSDGGTALYVHESQVAEPVEKTVALDFSGGDMTVTPEDGKVFSGVNIPVPEGLIPANIAEGVKIAGIIGTLAAGGGGLRFAAGIFQRTNSGNMTVESNHGFKPDLIIAYAYSSSKIYATSVVFGVSAELNAAVNATTGVTIRGFCVQHATNAHYVYTLPTTIETTATTADINNASENAFSTYVRNPYIGKWIYLILGGLT